MWPCYIVRGPSYAGPDSQGQAGRSGDCALNTGREQCWSVGRDGSVPGSNFSHSTEGCWISSREEILLLLLTVLENPVFPT